MPREKRVLARLAPPAYDVVVPSELKHSGDVGGIVLEIPVERHDETSSRMCEPCCKRSGLSEVFRESNDADHRVATVHVEQLLECRVLTAVVDENDLV